MREESHETWSGETKRSIKFRRTLKVSVNITPNREMDRGGNI
jgi:hypothetical protein